MFKSCLPLVLGIACLVSAICVDADSLAASRVSLLTPEDAATVQGAVCPMEVQNANDVCTGNNGFNWCFWTGIAFCGGTSCGYTCSTEEVQKYVRTWPATNPCYAVNSANANCPATANDMTCAGAVLGTICICVNPPIPVNCPAGTWTRWFSCN